MKVFSKEKYLRLSEAATLLEIHPESLRRAYVKTGLMPSIKFKNTWWVPKSSIKQFFVGIK